MRGGRLAELLDQLKLEEPELFRELQTFSRRAEMHEGCAKKTLSLEAIKDDREKFRFYTGLPNYGIFMALLNYFHPNAERMQYVSQYGKTLTFQSRKKNGPSRRFTLEEQILLLW